MRYCLICLLLCFFASSPLFAQKKRSKSAVKEVRQVSLLDQAREVKDDDPGQAIRLLERVIFSKSKKRNFKDEGEAYMLLGEIYENIDQPDLALARYDEAETIFKTGGLDVPADLYERKGILFLKLNQFKQSISNFNACITFSSRPEVTASCQAGLAEVDLAQGKNDESLDQLDYLQNNYALDSATVSRVEAARSQNYAQQSDFENAKSSYYNSVKNLPDKDANSYALEQITNANIELQKASENMPEREAVIYETSSKILEQKQSANDLFLAENIRLTNKYLEANDLDKAAELVDKSKAVIRPTTKPERQADIYKSSYEINRKIGRLDKAYDDLLKYTESKELAIDDLRNQLSKEIDIVKNQQAIDLSKKDQALLYTQLKTQKIISGLLGLLLSGALVFFYFLHKSVNAKRKVNQLLLLKSLRTQMNPHFIFNALNSVNNFIAKNDEKAANKFLSDFSKLMRKVLDYSQEDFISLEEEMELNELYLKLEHFRFRDQFEYEFVNNVEHHDLKIPPMLIQPFIENAVWHGLRYKEGHGRLSVHLSDTDDILAITIQDNGIGRENSKKIKTKNQKTYKSTGLNNVAKRIALINEIYDKNYQIEVKDASEDKKEPGTLVAIRVPI